MDELQKVVDRNKITKKKKITPQIFRTFSRLDFPQKKKKKEKLISKRFIYAISIYIYRRWWAHAHSEDTLFGLCVDLSLSLQDFPKFGRITFVAVAANRYVAFLLVLCSSWSCRLAFFFCSCVILPSHV